MAETKPSRSSQVSCVACSVCGNYQPIESQTCSRCGTSFVVTPPNHQNSSIQAPALNGIDWRHQSKMHGLLLITTCNLITLLLLIGAFFTKWFIRTPLDGLSIYYYIDHASYSTQITGYNDKFPYSQCNEYDGEHCDDMKEYETVSTPLWITSFFLLLTLTVFTSLSLLPYHIYKCRNNACLLSLSKPNQTITIFIVFVFITLCIAFALTSSALIPFMKSFPYKIYCFYQEYDDDNIGCQWGSALSYGLAANTILVHSVLFALSLLLVYRRRSPSSAQEASTFVVAADSNLLSEGAANYHQPQQVQEPVSTSNRNQCWKLFVIFACTLSVAVDKGARTKRISTTSLI